MSVRKSNNRTEKGGRSARRRARLEAPVEMLPPLEIALPLYEPLNEEEVEGLHEASMRILEEIGIDFRDPEALEYWRQARADIDGNRVRIDRGLLMELISLAPERFVLSARNPERDVPIGGRSMAFVPTYGSPFVLDFDNQRRYSTLEDLQAFHRLAYLSPSMHLTGGVTCEPVDIAVPKRHLHIVHSALKNSDKPFMGATTARDRAEDTVAMAKIVFGEDFLEEHVVLTAVLSCNSPLVWDATMLDALKVYAANNQAIIPSPFVMAGASTPASMVGAVAQINAEALAGTAFAQLVRKGAPVIYGQFLATVNMQSGAPMAGTPEISLMNFMIGQLARRYRLPWRSSGMTAGSKLADAQAAYESSMTMQSVLLAGANYVFHAAGWLEGGLMASFAKFLLDAEQMEMYHRFGSGIDMSDLDEAIAAMHEVGPSGHFLGTAHTLERFQSAFFAPKLLDNSSFEQWTIDGAKDASQRASQRAREMLDSFEAPPLSESIDEALKDFIAKREQELPDDVS
ncbi:MAG: trimethylamine methyltransferase family protein [Ectothiorhodospiraceae bacterium AqS1]|nr:trimethylamine methyltransferase family protein [Ectothiorhodospiraceae bacterium AqS1]